MSNSFDTVVNTFYLAYYGRSADPAGLAYWTQQLEDTGGDFSGIANAFATSAEATTRFGGASVADHITAIYQQLFNRGPEAAGLAYWFEAVESGRASLAAVALDIAGGAQGSDITIADAREYASQSFTAAISASGADYDGDVSRVLISSVTASTSRDSIPTLVDAAVTLSDIAHDYPGVYSALTGGGELAALFASARGQAEPESLLQALAALARSAAGDPATLETLLQGGGMSQVFEAMPSDMSLQDVVDALNDGGLAAATALVYTAADTAAPAILAIVPGANDGALSAHESLDLQVSFDEAVTVSSGATIQLANGGVATYTGGSGSATLTFHYVPQAGQDTDVIVLAASAAFSGTVADLAGNALASTAFDGLALAAAVSVDTGGPTQTISFTTIAQSGGDSASVAGSADPLTTNLATTTVHALLSAALAANEYVEYSLDNGQTWSTANATVSGTAVTIDALSVAASPTLMLRVADRAGNPGSSASQAIVYDGVAPQVGTLGFVAVTESAADSHADNVTNVAVVSAVLRIDGALPAAGEQLQYSLDGSHWRGDGLQLDSASGQLTISGIDLAQGTLSGGDQGGDRMTTVSVRALDGAGNVTLLGSQDLVYDSSAGAVTITLDQDSAGKYGAADDGVTNVGSYTVSGVDAGSHAEYSLTGAAGSWSTTPPLAAEGANTIYVRQVDGAGNAGAVSSLAFTLDTQAPPALSLVLLNDSGALDNITNDGRVQVSGLDGAGWEYALDGGDWVSGGAASNGSAVLTVAGEGAHTVLVRQYDAAGNVSVVGTLAFTLDTLAPSVPVVGLVQDTGTIDNITSNGQVVVSGLDGVSSWQYSIDSGSWTAGAAAVDGQATLTVSGDRAHTVQVRQVDAAGNASDSASLAFTLDTTVPKAPTVALVKDTGTLDGITSNGQLTVGGLSGSVAWEYSLDGADWVTGTAAVSGKGTLTVSGEGAHTVLVRQTDGAGNVSSSGSLSFTLDTTAPTVVPVFDHVEGSTTVSYATNLTQADVVFSYTGSFDVNDIIQVRTGIGNWITATTAVVDQDAHTITLTDVDLSASDPFMALRVIDKAGFNGSEAGVTINGPYGNIIFSVEATADGLAVTSSANATMYIQSASGTLTKVVSTTGGGALGGSTVLVGQQSSQATGTLVLKASNGDAYIDLTGTVYSLGSSADDILYQTGASVVWGYGGNDMMYGKENVDDVLYGGAGDDRLYGYSGNDTLVAGTGSNNVLTGGAGADKLDISQGTSTVIFDAGDSTLASMDVVTFAASLAANTGKQYFYFPNLLTAQYHATGVADPVDTSSASLMAALDTAYQSKAGSTLNAAVIVEFANHDQYLVVDTDGGGIGANDVVIQLVGVVPDTSLVNGRLVFDPATSL